MPNKNYIKGRRKEYKVVNQFKKEEYIAFRSAGSHSPIDVVAINPLKKIINLIQCKPNDMSENAKQKLYDANKYLEGEYIVIFEIV